MKMGSATKFWGPKTSIFFVVKIQTLPSSDGCCAGTSRNSGKSKTTGITTISRLPSHLRLVKFGLGAFEISRTSSYVVHFGHWPTFGRFSDRNCVQSAIQIK